MDVTKPLEQIVQEAIYKVRWVDAFKDGGMATDERIAKAVIEALALNWKYSVYATYKGENFHRVSHWFPTEDEAKTTLAHHEKWKSEYDEYFLMRATTEREPELVKKGT